MTMTGLFFKVVRVYRGGTEPSDTLTEYGKIGLRASVLSSGPRERAVAGDERRKGSG
jgi:hypothetical protein